MVIGGDDHHREISQWTLGESFSYATVEKRVLARMSRATVSPGRHHPLLNRCALASSALVTAPTFEVASSWAWARGVVLEMATRFLAGGGTIGTGGGGSECCFGISWEGWY